ncbi:MAG: hypothetical protein U1F61_09005 [Opitutaceae bacterium]
MLISLQRIAADSVMTEDLATYRAVRAAPAAVLRLPPAFVPAELRARCTLRNSSTPPANAAELAAIRSGSRRTGPGSITLEYSIDILASLHLMITSWQCRALPFLR